jgi:hypothetical protein
MGGAILPLTLKLRNSLRERNPPGRGCSGPMGATQYIAPENRPQKPPPETVRRRVSADPSPKSARPGRRNTVPGNAPKPANGSRGDREEGRGADRRPGSFLRHWDSIWRGFPRRRGRTAEHPEVPLRTGWAVHKLMIHLIGITISHRLRGCRK